MTNQQAMIDSLIDVNTLLISNRYNSVL